MRASSETVERPNAKGGMRMPLACGIMISVGMRMDMQVGVGLTVVRMVVRVDMEPSRLSKSPDSDPDQHRANDTLTPSRDGLDGQTFPEAQGCQPHESHARGMA